MTPEEQNRLLDDLLEGDISEADFLRLEAEMIVDEEVRVAYYDRLKLQTGLEKEADAALSAPGSSRPSARRNRRAVDPFLYGAIGLLMLLVVLLGVRIRADTQRLANPEEPVAEGYGVVAELSEVEWKNGTPLRRGDLVPADNLQLESGVVRIELFNGVILFFSGETTFAFRSEEELELERGSVRVRIPSMVDSFLLSTSRGKFSAEGSEYAVTLSDEQLEAEVFDGKVTWQSEEEEEEEASLQSGKRYVRRGTEPFTESDLDPSRSAELEVNLAEHRDRRRTEWKRSSRLLREDPRLLLYYSLDESVEGRDHLVKDLSSSGNDGTIVRAEVVRNRWGNPSGGLDFTPTGSRVRVDISGEHESLTLVCWVKIDSLDRLYNSLFLTDGHELHEPHWQIMNDGRLFFSVRARDEKGKPDKHIAFSPPIWDRTRSGQWRHIASVYDGRAQAITHYVDGDAVSIDPLPEDLQPDKVVIGPASIGNWSEPRYRKDPGFVVRNLNGTIDEFAVFSKALDAAEIRELFDSGRL